MCRTPANLFFVRRMPADLLFDKEASADAIRFGGGLGAGRAIDENECKIYLVKTYT